MSKEDKQHNITFDIDSSDDEEIQVIKEERRMRTDDNPQSLTFERFLAAAHLASPYQHPVIGWMNDLDNMKITVLCREMQVSLVLQSCVWSRNADCGCHVFSVLCREVQVSLVLLSCALSRNADCGTHVRGLRVGFNGLWWKPLPPLPSSAMLRSRG